MEYFIGNTFTKDGKFFTIVEKWDCGGYFKYRFGGSFETLSTTEIQNKGLYRC